MPQETTTPSRTAPPPQQTARQVPPEILAHLLPGLLELSPQQFQQWRHHPVSQVFLRFLADYRKQVERIAVDTWLAGRAPLEEQGFARGKIVACAEMEELKLASVRMFYGLEEPDPR